MYPVNNYLIVEEVRDQAMDTHSGSTLYVPPKDYAVRQYRIVRRADNQEDYEVGKIIYARLKDVVELPDSTLAVAHYDVIAIGGGNA